MKATELRRILVANNSLDGMDRALEKAAIIEHYSGAEILVLETLYDRIAEEPDRNLPHSEQARLIEALKAAERNGLCNLITPFRQRVASVESRLVWAKDARNAIIDAGAEWGAQLIIKPVSEHHPIADFLHTPLDWGLMRHAHCAVLISKGDPWQAPRSVLAAVDVADQYHEALNREILRTAGTLADLLGTPVELVSAYPDLGQTVNELQVATDFKGIKDDMRASRRAAAQNLIDETGITVGTVHLLEGRPATVIPRLATDLGATVTVLGTSARQALGKVIIGNTAEDLIGRLPGDLVTVREPWS